MYQINPSLTATNNLHTGSNVSYNVNLINMAHEQAIAIDSYFVSPDYNNNNSININPSVTYLWNVAFSVRCTAESKLTSSN